MEGLQELVLLEEIEPLRRDAYTVWGLWGMGLVGVATGGCFCWYVRAQNKQLRIDQRALKILAIDVSHLERQQKESVQRIQDLETQVEGYNQHLQVAAEEPDLVDFGCAIF